MYLNKNKEGEIRDMEMIRGLKQIIANRGYIEIPSHGLSMFPLLRNGTVCRFVAFDPDRVKRGDILLFVACTGALVGHRYVKRVDLGAGIVNYICKGDSNPDVDPPVRSDQIVGAMESMRKYGTWLRSDSFLMQAWGEMVLSIPAFSKVIRMYLRLKRSFQGTYKLWGR
jgi:signal peptidase